MKFLIDFFPVLLFFIAYQWLGIYAATAVAIVTSCIQVIAFWLQNKKIDPTHLITLIIIVIFGGATLYLQDETFIKWKPTIINWLFAFACIASQFIGNTPLIKRMMSNGLTLPDNIWTKLNTGWALFFIVLGLLNLYVMYNFDTATWVDFKLFGMLGMTVIFIIAQGFYLMKHIENPVNVSDNNK